VFQLRTEFYQDVRSIKTELDFNIVPRVSVLTLTARCWY